MMIVEEDRRSETLLMSRGLIRFIVFPVVNRRIWVSFGGRAELSRNYRNLFAFYIEIVLLES